MMKIGILQKTGLALLLAVVAGVANASIVHTYYDPTGSGVVTYTDLGGQLEIKFDNTTDGAYSSLITGLVFDIVDDVEAVTVVSFLDGNNDDLSGYYAVGLNVDNNITPGHTEVDLAITTTNGVNGGIFNADDPGSNTANAFPDIAVLLLDVTSPDGWSLSEISNDFLRMQRTGLDGEASLKISSVPLPATAWLFGTGLLGLAGVARRKTA